MPKINRYDGNVVAFSSDQQAGERFVFGSSSVTSDDLTDQYTPEAIRGWGTVGPSEFPPLEWFNAVGFTATQFSAYLHQMGVAEWNASQEYFEDSVTTRNGSLYVSISNSNVGNDPESSPSDWRVQGSKGSLLNPNGYEILESGLIMQWGNRLVNPAGTVTTFPIPFPNQCFVVMGIHFGGVGTDINVVSYAYNPDNCTLAHDDASNVQVAWLALGR